MDKGKRSSERGEVGEAGGGRDGRGGEAVYRPRTTFITLLDPRAAFAQRMVKRSQN